MICADTGRRDIYFIAFGFLWVYAFGFDRLTVPLTSVSIRMNSTDWGYSFTGSSGNRARVMRRFFHAMIAMTYDSVDAGP